METKHHKTQWYQMTVTDIKKILETDTTEGLSTKNVLSRQTHYGKNSFQESKKITFLQRVLNQFKSPLVFVLLFATFATFFLKDFIDMWVIMLALCINVVIGVAQEKRADNAFQKLTESQEKFATVIRDGEKREIKAEDLVPGDIILLQAGTSVPADARIITSHGLMTNESMLTGEWENVSKRDTPIKKDVHITEQHTMIWMGTLVTKGTAKALVVNIGQQTQVGMIAEELAKTKEELIPLQKNIKNVAVSLSFVILVATIIILIAGIMNGNKLVDMIVLAIAVAVAATPEGLPAAVTVVLAIGMENILKKGGLVRNLLATETLGNTTVILTDKTGTITKAEMRIADILTERSIYHTFRLGHVSTKQAFEEHDKKDVLGMMLLAGDGYVEGEKNALGEWVVHGGPIERAAIMAGIESGIRQSDLQEQAPRLDLIPFESQQRFTASLNRHGGENSAKRRIYIAGAPEYLLEKAEFVYSEGIKKKMTDASRSMIAEQQQKESSLGMRVVGVGYTETDIDLFPTKDPGLKEYVLSKFVFAGLIVLHDPIREDVKDSIATAHKAGAQVIMLTGDNPTTALKVAREVGIEKENIEALTGDDIEKLDDDELYIALRRRKVFARVLPQQKLRIVQLLKSHGEIVAMTGDGINDAPALRAADIGIALGSGTDVAKEASDLILLNNSFSIIVSAIEEGRRLRDNLKKIVAYLLATSSSELILIGSALITGSPLPLLARQILWINIVEEGFMNFAFAFEPKQNDLMERDPRDASMKEVLTKDLKKLITIIVLTTGGFLVTLYFILLHRGLPIENIQTILFIALSVASIFFTFSIKNLREPIWKIHLFSNRYLVFAFLANIGALIFAIEFAPLRDLLGLISFESVGYFFIILPIGLLNLIVIETGKYFVFRKKKKNKEVFA